MGLNFIRKNAVKILSYESRYFCQNREGAGTKRGSQDEWLCIEVPVNLQVLQTSMSDAVESGAKTPTLIVNSDGNFVDSQYSNVSHKIKPENSLISIRFRALIKAEE